jgi:dipeptidase
MCDTFIALSSATADGSVIFAKNSDREANEAQQLEFHESKSYRKDDVVDCTYISIAQVSRTHAVVLSRPFWMWGAEMGANEYGVVIGNEAVFTKLKVKNEGVLTGMDMLRLALERAVSAVEAKNIIIDLLRKYGQGGKCGYQDKSFSYHNSFIIADKKVAWVLETAGEYWVTKKVKNYYAISNGLTIADDYYEIHPGAEAFARKKGWVKKKIFGFASAFSDMLYTRFSDCKLRREQANASLAYSKVSVQSAINHLRSHNTEPYSPSHHLLSNSICAHAGNSLTRHASQTTGSLIAHLTSTQSIFWVTATSTPCLSVFKPVWFGPQVLPDLGPDLDDEFNKESYWWKFEELHRAVLKDYVNKADLVKREQRVLEEALLNLVYLEGESGIEVTTEAFLRAEKLIEELSPRIKAENISSKPNLFYRRYWYKLNKRVGIE